jgi:UDP:flavonoid glycosyltransferase YjiC (YdhE family)
LHFIFSPIGSAGDVHPMLGPAVELHRRGHQVTFLVNGYFRELVERYGLRFLELGSKEEFVALLCHPDLWNPLRAFKYIFLAVVRPQLRRQYAVVAEHWQSAGAVAVANCLGFGARIAQEKLGLPLVTVHVQPAVIWSSFQPPTFRTVFGPRWLKRIQYALAERLGIDPVVCPVLNRFRGELGLPPMRQTTRWWHSPQCVLCLFPPWFALPQPDWPQNLVQTSFPLWDEEGNASLPPQVQEFLDAGEPPVVFTPGSANVFGSQFFQAAVEACRRLGRRGVLLSRFSQQVPQRLPDQVRHFPYVPFSRLLPRCAALVHHGGIGTTAQALAAGIPQLLMPLAHDQFDNAARVKRLNVGESIARSRFRGPRVAAKLQALLQSEAVGRSCRNVSAKFSGSSGVAAAADALERLGEGSRP